MTRRMKIGLMATLAAGLLAAATAFAVAGHGARHGVMKRVVAAAIDDALDAAQVTPEQRTRIHAARDRAFAALDEHRKTRAARMQELLRLFEADHVDPGQVQALRSQAEEEHRKIGDAISQVVLEAHDVLTPAQRRAVADYVRAHRRHHGG